MNIKIQKPIEFKQRYTSPRILLKILLENGKTIKYSSSKRKRIFSCLSRQKEFKKAYVKVSYGKEKCVKGCVCESYNDGKYDDYQEVVEILQAFLEECPPKVQLIT